MSKTKSLENHLEFFTCSGEFSFRKVLNMHPAPHILYDLQETSFSLEIFEKLYTLAHGIRRNQVLIKARIALYCPSESQYEIGQVLQGLASNGDTEHQLICFKNLHDATDWLRE